MAWEPKVNRHVVVVVDIGGKVFRRPGIITGFATDTNPLIRVGHSGEVYGNATVGVVRRTTTTDNTLNRYVSW